MLAQVDPSFDILLQRAKAGDAAALGSLLESYRGYLGLVAGSLLRTASRASVDVSDVVQETNLKACGKFPEFRGNGEPELVAWLRQILTNHVFNFLKKQKSPGQRPESLEVLLKRASVEAHLALAAPGSTPSAQAIAAGAGGPDGQRPGVAAARLQAGPGLVLPGETPARGGRPDRWAAPKRRRGCS